MFRQQASELQAVEAAQSRQQRSESQDKLSELLWQREPTSPAAVRRAE